MYCQKCQKHTILTIIKTVAEEHPVYALFRPSHWKPFFATWFAFCSDCGTWLGWL